ncbi:hypothetical protein B0H11DRAFT_1994298 [Mycena galericulata]|nr:hypothetical protein B0H11DRAFT_1994298 [Mycena galericulata]
MVSASEENPNLASRKRILLLAAGLGPGNRACARIRRRLGLGHVRHRDVLLHAYAQSLHTLKARATLPLTILLWPAPGVEAVVVVVRVVHMVPRLRRGAALARPRPAPAVQRWRRRRTSPSTRLPLLSRDPLVHLNPAPDGPRDAPPVPRDARAVLGARRRPREQRRTVKRAAERRRARGALRVVLRVRVALCVGAHEPRVVRHRRRGPQPRQRPRPRALSLSLSLPLLQLLLRPQLRVLLLHEPRPALPHQPPIMLDRQHRSRQRGEHDLERLPAREHRA